MRELARTNADLQRLVWLDGGRVLVALTRTYSFIVIDVLSGTVLQTVPVPSVDDRLTWRLSLFFAAHPNGTQLATADHNYSYSDSHTPVPARLWTLTANGLRPAALPPSANINGGVAFTPDGTVLVGGVTCRRVGAKESVGEIVWWDLERRAPGDGFAGHAELVTLLAFTADGAHLVSSGDDDYVRVWDVASRKEIANRKVKVPGRGFALAPDGRGLLLPSDTDGGLMILDPLANRKLGKPQELKGHTNKVTGVAYSPSGERFASVGSDFRLCLWSSDGSMIPQFVWGEPLRCVSFAPDGQTVAAGDSVGRIIVYDVD